MKDNCSVATNWSYIAVSLVVAVSITLLVIYMPGIKEIDSEILKIVKKFLTQFPSYIPVFFSNYAGVGNFWWPQVAAGAVLVSHQKYLKAFLLVFFTQGSYILCDVIKNFVGRERPSIYAGYSFPSGHALITTCFYGILIYLILKYTRSPFWRYFLVIIFALMIFMVAISRLWLGVHYPTDVIAGIFYGVIFANLYIIFDKFFKG